MKKTYLSILSGLLLSAAVFAQSPQAFKYQAVARDLSGNVLASQSVSFQISILQGSTSGTSVYTETHNASTNSFGLVNLEIGGGTLVSGDFSTIDWGADSYFVQIEMDETGGSSYSLMGTSQLMSVPYALHAKTVEVDNVDDADADSTNELQTISASGTNLTLSNSGGTVSILDGDTTYWKDNPNNNSIYYSSGGVAIGHTDSPSNWLHIKDTVGGNVVIIDGKTMSGLYLRNSSSATGLNSWTLVNPGTGTYRNSFNISHSDTNGVWTDRIFMIKPGASLNSLVIGDNGNVGIGTSNPSYKLSVNGNAIEVTGVPTPALMFNPSVSATKTGVIFQTSDQLVFGANGVANIGSIDLNAPAGSFSVGSNGDFNFYRPVKINNGGIIEFYNPSNTAWSTMRMTASNRLQNNYTIEIAVGELYISDTQSSGNKGVIRKSPDGNCWRTTVDNSGNLVTTAITCP